MLRRIAAAAPRRSSGALKQRRIPLPWPEGRDLRILSIDGGGIRGIFPAAILTGLEERYLDGSSVTEYFDLIAGTSTGGIIAIGLAAGLRASELHDLYTMRGCEIFPPPCSGFVGVVERLWRNSRKYFRYRYDRKALVRILDEILRERKFGDSRSVSVSE